MDEWSFEWGADNQDRMTEWALGEDDRDYEANHQGDAWEEAKREAKARDGHCQLCGCTSEEQRDRPDLWGDDLHAHHIEPVSSFDIPEEAHTPENLITLCAECHRKVETGELEIPDHLREGI